ncbi:MAG: DUF3367 domain-containing protein, partial [Actinobacteria bacterium]|nr:DUF3367 domain-containing protein [Actinomycetota bacterium]
VGLVIMSLGWPEGTPLRQAFNFTYNNFPAVQFLRSTYKAGPLVLIGLALLAGMAAAQLASALRGRSGLPPGLAKIVAPAAVLVLLALAAWPLVRGEAIDPLVSWKSIPKAWTATAAQLDSSLPENKRAMILPGQLYSFYNWGGTVDPILPALTDRPVAVRSYVPYADQRATDLQWTIDTLVQQQRVLPGQLTALLGLMGVGQVVTGTDDNRLLSGGATAADGARALNADGGLVRLGGQGPITSFPATAGTIEPDLRLAQVSRSKVTGGRGLIRVLPSAPQLVVDGSAETLAALAAVKGLPAKDPIFYSTDRTTAQLRAAAREGANFVVGDGNRRHVVVASRLRQSYGATVGANQSFSEDAAVLNRDSSAGSDAQSVAEYQGIVGISAPFSPGVAQFPEHRPYAAVDGDLETAWRADRNLNDSEWYLQLELPKARDVPYIDLYPDTDAEVQVTEVAVNGQRYPVHRGWNRLPVRLKEVSLITVELVGVTSPGPERLGGGGIRELQIPGVTVSEQIRLPIVVANALKGTPLDRSGLQYLLTRTTGDDPYRRDTAGAGAQGSLVRDRGDAEATFARRLVTPGTRSYAVNGLAGVAASAPDSAIDRLAGTRGPLTANSSGRYLGKPGWRASMAFDGSRQRAWLGTWKGSGSASISWKSSTLQTIAALRLAAPTEVVRRPTKVRLIADGRSGETVAVSSGGRVEFSSPVSGRSFTLQIVEARFPSSASGLERQRRAVGIGELTGDALPRLDVPSSGAIKSECGDSSVSIGSLTVGLQSSGSVSRLDSGVPLEVSACEPSSPVRVKEGSVVVQTLPALLLPEIVSLDSPAPAGPPEQTGGGELISAGTGTGSNRSGVKVDLSGPSWIVLGESWNRGWTATCDGRDLGRSQPIDAFANGWLAPADCRSVAFKFAPNATVQRLYFVSAAAILALLLMLVGMAIRRRGEAEGLEIGLKRLPDPDPPDRGGLKAIVIACCATAAVVGFCFSLRAGVLLGPAMALLVWRGVSNRTFFLVAGGLLATAVPILYVVLPVEDHGGYNASYAGDLVAAHWVAVVAVTLLGAGLLRSLLRARRG